MNLLAKINEWLEPKCDLCGKKHRKLLSDGIGIVACQSCWDKCKSKSTRFKTRKKRYL